MTESPATPGPTDLRVAMVCPYSLSRPGGVQGQAVGLVRALGDAGIAATLFAPLDAPADAPDGVHLVEAGRSVALPANGSRAPVSLRPGDVLRARSAVRNGGYHVVHVHEPFAPGLPYGLLAGSGLPPLVATFHRSGSSVLYDTLRPLTRRLVQRYAATCAVSEAARQTAEDALGVRSEVLFNGVDTDRIGAATPWPSDGPTVLFLGRHEERKGLRVLLEAFGRLGGDAATRPRLWVAGDGPETPKLRHDFAAVDGVEWLGVLDEEEKLARLAAADVLCAPSLGGESFGMVLLEALAAGTSIVASDLPGYRAAAGGCAWLVPPGDAGALAAALGAELGRAGTEEVTRHQAAGRARAEAWSLDRLATRYLEIYARVTGLGAAA